MPPSIEPDSDRLRGSARSASPAPLLSLSFSFALRFLRRFDICDILCLYFPLCVYPRLLDFDLWSVDLRCAFPPGMTLRVSFETPKLPRRPYEAGGGSVKFLATSHR